MKQQLNTTSKQELLAGLSQHQWVALLVLVCFGFFLRIAMIDMVEGTVPIRNDALEYYSYAANLKQFGTYSMTWTGDLADSGITPVPDRNRPPGYSLFLYPFVDYPPTESMVHTIRLTQVVLDTLTIVLSFFIFRHFLNFAFAYSGAALVAISPHLVAMNIYLLSETIFTFSTMLFLLLAVKAYAARRIWWALLPGALLGISLLLKPTMNLYLLFLAGILFWQHGKRRDLHYLGVLVLGTVLIMSPWIIRNYNIGFPEAAESKSLGSLQNGSYPGLMVNDDPATRGIPHRADPNYDQIQSYGDFFRDLIDKVSQQPVKYLNWYLFGKLEMMLSWNMVAGAGDIYVYFVEYSPYFDRQPFILTHRVMQTIHPILMGLSLLTMIWLVLTNRISSHTDSRHVTLAVATSILLYFIALHVAATPLPRYMIPLRPIMYGLALYGCSMAWGWIQPGLAVIKQTASRQLPPAS